MAGKRIAVRSREEFRFAPFSEAVIFGNTSVRHEVMLLTLLFVRFETKFASTKRHSVSLVAHIAK